MKITGGRLRGREVESPGRRIRPTPERVRQALFSILGGRISRACFLDLFAGSGVVGLEAWSRGAREVWWVESDQCALASLRRNVHDLAPDAGRVIPTDVRVFLERGLNNAPRFEFVFADPPYAHSAWFLAFLKPVDPLRLLTPGGQLILETRRSSGISVEALHGRWSFVGERRYGDTQLWFLEPNATFLGATGTGQPPEGKRPSGDHPHEEPNHQRSTIGSARENGDANQNP